MRQIHILSSFALALTVGLASCANLSGVFAVNETNGGPSRVEDLITRVERVHVECEVSREHVRESVAALRSVLDASQADPATAFTQFQRAITNSEKQAKALRASFGPMKRAASPFFEQWSNDLESFRSTELRQRSQERLAETRLRFDSIVASVEPTQAVFDSFNAILADRVLFLGHDFNSSSISVVRSEYETLEQLAVELVGRLDQGMSLTRDYVLQASPPIQLEGVPEQAGK